MTRRRSQLCCPAPDGLDRLDLVLEPPRSQVAFVTAFLSDDLLVADLKARFDAGGTAVAGPHEAAPTMAFGRMHLAGASGPAPSSPD
ncbi:hypothetical protein OHA72_09870 [Dactylosporangium sp. NBC_01737]|uniref:hypothetical protein n=1 Tax=Dactylosporangium sp. NBC_01737 TaxID=2975959 RepID=UPI002E15C5E3|nr:hypothetical protein OHA72_09870 [Dactylosporangium sp. NBC_01737]